MNNISNSISGGAIYYATGKKYLKQAIYSCKTLKRHNKISVTLFTDKIGSDILKEIPSSKIFDDIVIFELRYKPLKTKIQVLALTPYENTLFIDTDTEVRGDIYKPFGYLKDYDFAIAGMRWLDFSAKIPSLRGYEKPHSNREDIKMVNTGVIYFRKNDNVLFFLKFWLEKISDFPNKLDKHKIDCDQEVLNDLLGESEDFKKDVSFKMIPNTIYNCRSLFFKDLKKEGKYNDIVIVHEHGLDKSSIYKLKKWIRKSGSNIYRKYIKR